MTTLLPMTDWLRAAGLGQLLICVGSLAIPGLLHWRAELQRVSPLTRQVFWTYAGYIWGTNLAFGLLSTLAPGLLLAGDPLARAVAAFIALYWGTRLVIQLALFSRAARPPGAIYDLGEWLLGTAFAFFTLVSAWIALALP